MLSADDSMSMFKWFPTAKAARIYFVLVYGILFPWFAICFIWGGIFKGWPVSPLWLSLQIQDLLNLLLLPPLVGMGIDLLIARWADERYRPTIRRLGGIVILIAGFFVFLAVMRYYVLRS